MPGTICWFAVPIFGINSWSSSIPVQSQIHAWLKSLLARASSNSGLILIACLKFSIAPNRSPRSVRIFPKRLYASA